MIDDQTIKPLIAAVRAHDPALSPAEAEEVAWSIGDNIVVEDGKVEAALHGAPYWLPVAVVFPDAQHD